MDHRLELLIARLEILEIEVCNILQNPGNIGKRIFFDSVLSWKYWKTYFLTQCLASCLSEWCAHCQVLWGVSEIQDQLQSVTRTTPPPP